jgi:hypothetical protein
LLAKSHFHGIHGTILRLFLILSYRQKTKELKWNHEMESKIFFLNWGIIKYVVPQGLILGLLCFFNNKFLMRTHYIHWSH